MNYSLDKLKKTMDIVYIIKKLNEVDKLKNLLLNEDQMNLFEYTFKPTIRLNPAESKGHQYSTLLKNQKSNMENTFSAFKSY